MAYLQCSYSTGTYPDEYCISFKANGSWEHIDVKRNKVFLKKGTNRCLVDIVLHETHLEDNESLVRIREKRRLFVSELFYVPNDRIVRTIPADFERAKISQTQRFRDSSSAIQRHVYARALNIRQ